MLAPPATVPPRLLIFLRRDSCREICRLKRAGGARNGLARAPMATRTQTLRVTGLALARVIRVQGCTIVLCACRNCARFAYACETSMSIWFSMCVSGCVCGVWCVWVCSDWYLPSLRPGASWGSEEQEVAECSSTQFSSA